MKNILGFCIRDISFASCGEALIWIGTGALVIAAIVTLIKKPK